MFNHCIVRGSLSGVRPIKGVHCESAENRATRSRTEDEDARPSAERTLPVSICKTGSAFPLPRPLLSRPFCAVVFGRGDIFSRILWWEEETQTHKNLSRKLMNFLQLLPATGPPLLLSRYPNRDTPKDTDAGITMSERDMQMMACRGVEKRQQRGGS